MRTQKTKRVTLIGLFALFLMIAITATVLFLNEKTTAFAMEQVAVVYVR